MPLQVRLHSTASELAQAKAGRAEAKADKLEAALAQAQAMQAELLRRMSAVESKQLLKK